MAEYGNVSTEESVRLQMESRKRISEMRHGKSLRELVRIANTRPFRKRRPQPKGGD